MRSGPNLSLSEVALARPISSASFLVLVLAVIVIAVSVTNSPLPRGTQPRSKTALRVTSHSLHYAPGEVVVIANEGVLDTGPAGAPRARSARVSTILGSLGIEHARSIDPIAPANGTRHEKIWRLTSTRFGFDPVAAARALMATGEFVAVSPNYRLNIFSTTVNDPYRNLQWYIRDTTVADIRLPSAWDLEKGSSAVSIAIIDTGVDTGHPDLASKIWHNPDEIPGNGIDDDGNGLIDDTVGWDFGMNDNDPRPERTPDAGSGIDVGFHGTFCAGVAAAATNNAKGIAGASWNCTIMPLKCSSPDSGLTLSAVASAFAYATDKHASVISLSFGGPDESGLPQFFQALVDMATAAGTVCVAAAGNDSDSVMVYPAACARVLSVGATDQNGNRALYSNWGSWVDVGAPGSSLFSTISQNYRFTDTDEVDYIVLFGWDGQNPYMYGSGTSFSCPLVAGVCALVRSHFPSLTPGLVMQQVIGTGDAVAFDKPIGTKVNAFRAVSSVPTAVEAGPQPVPRLMLAASPNPAPGALTISFSLARSGPIRLALFDARGRRVRTLFDVQLSAGPHEVNWDGRDQRGERLPASVYFARLESSGKGLDQKIVLINPAGR